MEPTPTPSPNPEPTPTPTPNPTPSPAPYDWSKDVPKGSEKVFESFKGKPLSDVLASHVAAQQLIGGSIRLPNEKDTPEQKAAKLKDIRTKLGMPESSDKYDLGELKSPHESFKWDDARLKSAKDAMHAAGFTNEQAKEALRIFGEEIKSFYPDNSAVAAQNRTKLIEEYGSEQAYDRNMAYAGKAVRQFGGDEFANYLEQTGLGNHPAMVKFAAKIGRELAEHGGMEPAESDLGLTKAQAQQKINDVLNNPNDPYYKKSSAGHKERVDEVNLWYRVVAGEI